MANGSPQQRAARNLPGVRELLGQPRKAMFDDARRRLSPHAYRQSICYFPFEYRERQTTDSCA